MDAYGYDNSTNYYMEPVSHSEIIYNSSAKIGALGAGEMMHRSDLVSVNDIEMMLFARKTNQLQYFVPIARTCTYQTDEKGNDILCTDESFTISPAIKDKYIYKCCITQTNILKDNDAAVLGIKRNKYYIYDDNINSYVLIDQNIFNIYVNVYGADYMLKNMI